MGVTVEAAAEPSADAACGVDAKPAAGCGVEARPSRCDDGPACEPACDGPRACPGQYLQVAPHGFVFLRQASHLGACNRSIFGRHACFLSPIASPPATKEGSCSGGPASGGPASMRGWRRSGAAQVRYCKAPILNAPSHWGAGTRTYIVFRFFCGGAGFTLRRAHSGGAKSQGGLEQLSMMAPEPAECSKQPPHPRSRPPERAPRQPSCDAATHSTPNLSVNVKLCVFRPLTF